MNIIRQFYFFAIYRKRKVLGKIVFSDGSEITTFPSGNSPFNWSDSGNGIFYNSGSVSIGGTSPRNSEKLDVVGTLNANAFSINGETFITSRSSNTSIFLGHNAGENSSGSQHSTVMGVEAGYNLDTGNYNTFIGYKSGYSSITASKNSFVGSFSGYANVTGVNNSFFGYESGYSNNAGSDNSYFGYQSGRNSSGSRNSFFGSESGYQSSGSNNNFIGYRTGYNSDGEYNVLVGNESGFNADGSNNTYIGYQAGHSGTNAIGYNNTVLGYRSGFAITSGAYNVFLGFESGISVTEGTFNTFVGSGSGSTITTGTGNVFIGYNSGEGLPINSSNLLRIGIGGNPLIQGVFATPTGSVQINGNLHTIGTATSSDQRLKQDISPITNSLTKVLKLRPVRFKYRWDEFKKYSFSKGFHIGFIAQEVEKLFPEVVQENLDGYKGVNYSALSSVLVDSIQTQDSQLKELEEETLKLKQMIKEIESKLKLNLEGG